jgi:hypothetical protein
VAWAVWHSQRWCRGKRSARGREHRPRSLLGAGAHVLVDEVGASMQLLDSRHQELPLDMLGELIRAIKALTGADRRRWSQMTTFRGIIRL